MWAVHGPELTYYLQKKEKKISKPTELQNFPWLGDGVKWAVHGSTHTPSLTYKKGRPLQKKFLNSMFRPNHWTGDTLFFTYREFM